ncbi:MAG: hypothetical protein ABIQ01_01060 [Pseudolysinimonas sp.]
MLLSGLLAALATADLLRPSDARPTKQQRTRSWFAGMAAVAVLGWGLGLSPWIALAGAIVLALWLLFTPVHRRSSWALAGLAIVVVLTIFVFDPLRVPPTEAFPPNPFSNWYTSAAPDFLRGIAFGAFATAIAAFLFLLNSANFVVRIMVDLTGVEVASDDPDVETTAATTGTTRARKKVALKGGRFLGPIERIMILALGLAGQFGAIAAVVGAKSIIRYPEISKSNDGGKTAEYFLIGSGLSWGLALLALAVSVLSR